MEADALIGATIGHYRVTSTLGHGSGAVRAVYLAELCDTSLPGRRAVIKVLTPALSRQPQALRRFFHEVRTAGQLHHPGLINVIEYGTLPDVGSGPRAYVTMDYLEGESLEARLDRTGPLSLIETLKLCHQLAVGLAAAHAAEVVHRDLKPSSVFLLPSPTGGGEQRVKILDFGLGRLARGDGRVIRSTATLGAPLYVAPEQGRNDEVDARADIYSLGCLMFSMLTARPPFVADEDSALVDLHRRASVPSLASLGVVLPAGVSDLLAILLEKSPAQRLPSMRVVALRIAVLLADEDVMVEIGPADSAELRAARRPELTLASLRKRPSGVRTIVPPAEPAGQPATTNATAGETVELNAVAAPVRGLAAEGARAESSAKGGSEKESTTAARLSMAALALATRARSRMAALPMNRRRAVLATAAIAAAITLAVGTRRGPTAQPLPPAVARAPEPTPPPAARAEPTRPIPLLDDPPTLLTLGRDTVGPSAETAEKPAAPRREARQARVRAVERGPRRQVREPSLQIEKKVPF
jgi:tRNA A-37 threonylcarbamoyl transferase component Bud32